MWVYGMDPEAGVIRTPAVGKLVGELMGGLEGLEDELYNDADKFNLEWSVDLSDPTNEIATVEGYVFPLDTDYVILADGGRKNFPSITVYAPMTVKLYLSAEAIEWIVGQM